MSHQSDSLITEISFEPTEEGATLRWESDLLGTRTSRFVSPLAAPELELALRALDLLQDPSYPVAYTVEQQRRFHFNPDEQALLGRLGLWSASNSVADNAPRRIGQALYQALTDDPAAAQALGTLRDHATALDQALQLHLCFPPDAVYLAALPWELLWDDGPAPLLLSRGKAGACVRQLSLALALPPPRPSHGPLRILAVTPQAGIPTELRRIERAARLSAWRPLLDSGQALMHEVSPADRLALLAAIERDQPPDVVHFYGHGRYHNGQGALLLDAPGGQGSWTNTSTLAALFGGVGLVVLHACQGGTVAEHSLLTGIAPALSAAGVPAVIAMQLSVRSDAATQISGSIYTALAAGQSIQQAIAEARRALYVAEDDQVSWFVPVLYLRSREDGPIFLRRPAEAVSLPATLGAAPALAAAPTASRGPIQAVIARGGGVVRMLRMRGGRAAIQQIRAEDHSVIEDLIIDDRG